MIKIEEIKKIDKKHIALMDTSSITFMQGLQNKKIQLDCILKDYELILIPKWVLTDIVDAPGRAEYVQNLIDVQNKKLIDIQLLPSPEYISEMYHKDSQVSEDRISFVLEMYKRKIDMYERFAAGENLSSLRF